MRTKLALLAGAAVGYVLGTRAGRQQFDKIKDQAQKVWESPKVQEAKEQATGFVKEKTPELKDKLTGGTRSHGSDDLDTFTTSGVDETAVGQGTTSSSSSTSTYPTGSEGTRI